HREGAPRWSRLGPAELFPARSAPDESMGGRSYARAGGRNADPGARHVRALVSARLWRLRGAVRRRVHGEHQLDPYRGTSSSDSGGRRARVRVRGLGRHSVTATTDHRAREEWTMQQKVAPIAVRPSTLSGLSERMIVSHYEDCYGNAVRALNVVRRE